MAFKAVLLDLDGTLWDSFPWYADILASESEASARELLDELRHGGNIVRLVRRVGVTQGRFARRCKARASELALFPGAEGAVRGFSELGVPLAAVTSLPGRLAGPMLEGTGLSPYFQVVVDAGSCSARKPSPGPILTALDGLGVPAGEDSVYAGDLPLDGQSAARAGVSFAWASYGYGKAEPENTAIVLERLDDLLPR